MWTTMVLIPKGKWEYRVIGLVETIWKVCTSIVNSWLQSSIVLHDVLHGFIQGGGRNSNHRGQTGATTREDSSQAIILGLTQH